MLFCGKLCLDERPSLSSRSSFRFFSFFPLFFSFFSSCFIFSSSRGSDSLVQRCLQQRPLRHRVRRSREHAWLRASRLQQHCIMGRGRKAPRSPRFPLPSFRAPLLPSALVSLLHFSITAVSFVLCKNHSMHQCVVLDQRNVSLSHSRCERGWEGSLERGGM